MLMSVRTVSKVVLTLLLTAAFVLQPAPVHADLPESSFISNFTGHAQSHSLSCEARSAADLANFWGVDISENGILYELPASENPDKGFVGNADDYWGNIPPHSYGVHAEPIAKELRKHGLKAHSELGITLDDLRAQIADGNPVIVWVIGQMTNGTADRIELSNKDQVVVAAYEHTMLVTGYDQDAIQVFDPYYGIYETFTADTFATSWAVLGNMAVTVTGLVDDPEKQADDEQSAAQPDGQSGPETYTVQYGDYLIALADQFGVDWHWLVEVNNIPYPWTIFPGQVLRIK
jgi:uncharacterized protein YvpB